MRTCSEPRPGLRSSVNTGLIGGPGRLLLLINSPRQTLKTRERTVIKAALRAYPDSDLLPVDLKEDSLKQLVEDARKNNFGDTLFSFIILELAEGLDGGEDWAGAAKLIGQARDDLQAVLSRLCGAGRLS